MTLATVPRYDRDQTAAIGEHAVVVGGSMAGLVAARVLSDSFETVTVIDRDSLPDEPGARDGVPHARHPHVLLEAGRAILEDLFPGYGEELISAGGLLVDGASDFNYFDQGDFVADGPTPQLMYFASRPLFELTLRRRVAQLDGVRVRPGCQFIDYVVDDASATVGGVVVRGDGAERETSVPIWSSMPPAGRVGHRRGSRTTATCHLPSTRCTSTWPTAAPSSSDRPLTAARCTRPSSGWARDWEWCRATAH